ncbi:hypothetical protein PFISCL1PPCAC_26612, partial [Pristionchus fissidentatus]
FPSPSPPIITMNTRQFVALLLAVCYLVAAVSAAPSRVMMRFGKRAAGAALLEPQAQHADAAMPYAFLPYGAMFPQFEGFEDGVLADQ